MTDEPWFTSREPDEPAVLSLGCMNFGGKTGQDASRRIIARALEAGVRLLDTANMYGDGSSERIVGEALHDAPPSARVATKVGLLRIRGRAEGLAPERVLEACDESLARLGVEAIDLYYLHAPDPAVPLDETLGAIGDLLRAGRIRRWGVSNFASWQILELMGLAAARGLPGPAVAQQLYNPLVRQLDLEYFRFACAHPIHTTIYNPLAGGLLARDHDLSAKPAPGSRFHRNPHYQRRYWHRSTFEARDALAAIARDAGLTLVELTYAFVLGHPGVDSVLVGPREPEHLEVALAATRHRLSDEVRRRVLDVGVALVGTDASYAR